MDWSIQDIARLAHTTSRTLRHYGDVGLLTPSRVGSKGYRYYDEGALVRLQRILMLRALGLGLPEIGHVLTQQRGEVEALQHHLDWLRQEQQRLARQIRSVENTINTLDGDEQLMAEKMFDGFDHTQYREEVEQRWGKEAHGRSDTWWRSMSAAGKAVWQQHQQALSADWQAAALRGVDPTSDEAQALAQRQFDWLRGIPGTPGGGTDAPPRAYFVGLAEMYVADERFAANYGGVSGAEFVRDAMLVFGERHL